MIHWRSWVLAARPKTLPAAIVPVWAGVILSWKLTGQVGYYLATLTVLGALFIQIATNFFNDVIDAQKGADTAHRIGPQRATVSGLLSSRTVYFGAFAMLVLAIACGGLLYQERGWPIIAIGVPSLYLAYGYTGGPFPLAYRGVGEVFVILFFGLVAVSGTVFLQTGKWYFESLLLGLQIGLLSAVLIAVNNYRDIDEDRLVDKKTLAVRFGRPVVRRLIVVMTFLPAVLICFHSTFSLLWFVPAVVLALVFVIVEMNNLRENGVPSFLLGLSALHLILFVLLQNLVMALT